MKEKLTQAKLEKLLAKFDDIASSALSDLIMDYPIIGYTALQVGGVEVVDDIYPAIGWTDFKAIYINAPYCNRMKLGKEHIKFLIAHEVMHILTMTARRQGTRDPRIFNVASDFAINQALIEDEKIYDINGKVTSEGQKCIGQFIESGCYDKKYRYMSAEDIYDQLMKEVKKIQIQGGGNGKSNNSNDTNGNGEGEAQSDSGYGGEFEDAEQRDREGKLTLDVHLDTNDPKIQQDLEEATMRAQKILEDARQRGTLSTGMTRLLGEIPKVKQDWKKDLNRYIRSFKKSNSSWKKPNKRFFCGGDPVKGGHYFPSRYETPCLNLAVGIDTSGSISDHDVANFFGHIYKILSSYKHFRMQIFCWSTRVHKKTYRDLNEKNYMEFKPSKDWLESDGGTIAQTGFDFISEMDKKNKPDIYICFTDGYIESDIKFEKCPVIFAINKGVNENFKAPESCKKAKVMMIED